MFIKTLLWAGVVAQRNSTCLTGPRLWVWFLAQQNKTKNCSYSLPFFPHKTLSSNALESYTHTTLKLLVLLWKKYICQCGPVYSFSRQWGWGRVSEGELQGNWFLLGIFITDSEVQTARNTRFLASHQLWIHYQSHSKSFTDLKKYTAARFLYITLGPKPPPRAAVISRAVAATAPFTVPKALPRLPSPRESGGPSRLSPSGKAARGGRTRPGDTGGHRRQRRPGFGS